MYPEMEINGSSIVRGLKLNLASSFSKIHLFKDFLKAEILKIEEIKKLESSISKKNLSTKTGLTK